MNCIVEHLVTSRWRELQDLLAGFYRKPLAFHASLSAERLGSLCLARAEIMLQSPETITWVARSSAKVQGFVSMTMLPWDSVQLGMQAARVDFLVANGTYYQQLETKGDLLDKLLMHCASNQIQHITARADSSELSSLHASEQAGFIIVDGVLTYALELDSFRWFGPKNDNFRIRLASPSDSEAVANLGRVAYTYDRFHSDPAISPERASELHAAWLRNSCAGNAADAVVMAEDNRGIVGFVTCKLQHDTKLHLGKLLGTIVLVATEERARGRGIGKATTLAALEWFSKQGADIIEVGTQMRNIAASRLYETLGFRLVGSSVSLRKLL